jgi:hypothetical protein
MKAGADVDTRAASRVGPRQRGAWAATTKPKYLYISSSLDFFLDVLGIPTKARHGKIREIDITHRHKATG